ncbi:hypothetical protein [Allomesorhizobium camelthorni]|uniref:Uncharacterized protein n=1 Tax=Allomesorhizobium camelthorni TaxID=475069 RepID=A0A6G4WL44_9HYPH|nr:hypothetical protein [Mesorhizobium camelthorni]NGO55344.1 hypothetical protein [Mesorhizobium camelthorni]
MDGMIHARHLHGSPPKNGGPVPESSRRRDIFAAVEASLSAVRRANRAADESQRVHHAPEPRATTNTIFDALYDKHQRHREPLFEALRRFDVARRRCGRFAAGLAEADGPAYLIRTATVISAKG